MKLLQAIQQQSDYHKSLYEKWVAKCEFHFVGIKTTVCVITINNGFEIVGTSACVDPTMFDASIGRRYALQNALQKLDELAGFAMQQELSI